MFDQPIWVPFNPFKFPVTGHEPGAALNQKLEQHDVSPGCFSSPPHAAVAALLLREHAKYFLLHINQMLFCVL